MISMPVLAGLFLLTIGMAATTVGCATEGVAFAAWTLAGVATGLGLAWVKTVK